MREIDDNYATCVQTYATLCVYSDDIDPDEITKIIGIEPTSICRKGEVRTQNPKVKNPYYKMNGWFYGTKDASNSRDSRRHLDILLDGPLKQREVTSALRERGCRLDVTIFYLYRGGGPTISPDQMRGMADADIDVWWDLYRDHDDEM
jgi:hypothetical protein